MIKQDLYNGAQTLNNIIRQSHGHQLDHIGIGVADTEAGVAEIEALTGAKIALDPPIEDQWYWSGALPLGSDSYAEIIGPNPTNDISAPLRPWLSQLDKPSVHFWYIAVKSMAEFSLAAEAAGASVIFETQVNEEDDPASSRYIYAGLGPDFVLQKPSLIEWERHVQREGFHNLPVVCELVSLELFHPNAAQYNPVLEHLGCDARIETGESRFRFALDTPNGRVVFDNPGVM
ncbi:MAG: VOC family protein [Pseudomonadota bacterium]